MVSLGLAWPPCLSASQPANEIIKQQAPLAETDKNIKSIASSNSGGLPADTTSKHTGSVTLFESFRALKLSRFEDFRALKS